jgi:hypothetical protein
MATDYSFAGRNNSNSMFNIGQQGNAQYKVPEIGYPMGASNGLAYGQNGGMSFEQMQELQKANQPSALTTGFKNFGLAAQGIGSLYGMYNAGKSRKLAERQMGLTLADSNRSLANNTLSYNQDLMERTRNGLIANSVKEGSPEWNRRIAQANASKVDGSPIA